MKGMREFEIQFDATYTQEVYGVDACALPYFCPWMRAEHCDRALTSSEDAVHV